MHSFCRRDTASCPSATRCGDAPHRISTLGPLKVNKCSLKKSGNNWDCNFQAVLQLTMCPTTQDAVDDTHIAMTDAIVRNWDTLASDWSADSGQSGKRWQRGINQLMCGHIRSCHRVCTGRLEAFSSRLEVPGDQFSKSCPHLRPLIGWRCVGSCLLQVSGVRRCTSSDQGSVCSGQAFIGMRTFFTGQCPLLPCPGKRHRSPRLVIALRGISSDQRSHCIG